MQLAYRLPGLRMQGHLSVHALLHGILRTQTETLPAMLPNLHIRLAGRSSYRFGDGPMTEAPSVSLIGPTSQIYQMKLEPGLIMMATGFLPMGWMRLMHMPAMDHGDRVVDGADIWGDQAVDRLCDQLLEAKTMAERWNRIEAFLVALMRPAHEDQRRAVLGIDHWLEASKDLCLDDLAQSLDVGFRHLRRLTQNTHGASPKTLAMKYRCLRAAAALSAKGGGGHEEALSAYADQAHMIRDFHRFVGWTPRSFAGDVHGAAASTLRGRREAGAVRPLSLLS